MSSIRLRFSLVLGAAAAVLPGQDKALRFDDARLRQMVERIAPAVERAAGCKFTKPPVAMLADVGDVMRSLRDDIAPPLRAFYKGQPEARIQRAIQMRADLMASSMLGKYGAGSRETYVLAHMLDVNLDLFGFDRAIGDDMLQLVIAHELVHALQDQEIDLGKKIREATDQDQAAALSMLIEGHAVFCSERAAVELGLTKAIEPLRRLFRGDTPKKIQSTSQIALRPSRGSGLAYYSFGERFMAHHHAAGGDARLWEILKSAVPESVRVFRPDTWAEPPATREDLTPCLEGTGKLLGGGNWTFGQGSVGEALLRSENLPKALDLEPLLLRLRGGVMLEGCGATPAVRATVMVLAFADDDSARCFVELAEASAALDGEALQHEPAAASGVHFVAGAAPAADGFTGRRWTQIPEKPGLLRCELVWNRKGRHVLQITLVGVQLSDEKLVEIGRLVFGRL